MAARPNDVREVYVGGIMPKKSNFCITTITIKITIAIDAGGKQNVCVIPTDSIDLKGKFMRSFSKVVIAFLATFVFSNADAIIMEGYVYRGQTHVVDMLYHIDVDGTIRNVRTGLVVTKQEAVDSIPAVAPIVVGIIIGAAGNAGAMILAGGDAKQVLIAGAFGAVSGYYGALATMSGWFSIIVYGSGAVGAQVVGSVAVGPITVIQIYEPITPPMDYTDFDW